jgi:hypothetical protein
MSEDRRQSAPLSAAGVVPKGDGSHLLLRMRIGLRGPMRWVLPLVRRRMQRELARDVVTVKGRLEGAEQTSGSE